MARAVAHTLGRMTATLARLHWGDPASARRALLVHGIGSSAATTWRLAEALAEAGWSATAVDLRGHGRSPRTASYRLSDYAGDLAATRPDGGGAWEAVVAHSLGGVAAVLAAGADWAERLVLLDPALRLTPETARGVAASQRAARAANTVEAVSAANPHWHPVDVEEKVRAVEHASAWGVERTGESNAEHWDALDAALALPVPTLLLVPELGPLVDAAQQEALRANALIRQQLIEGAGHNLHRDRLEATAEAALAWLG